MISILRGKRRLESYLHKFDPAQFVTGIVPNFKYRGYNLQVPVVFASMWVRFISDAWRIHLIVSLGHFEDEHDREWLAAGGRRMI